MLFSADIVLSAPRALDGFCQFCETLAINPKKHVGLEVEEKKVMEMITCLDTLNGLYLWAQSK